MQALTEAFKVFNETTRNLERAHRELQRRVQQVDAELEKKNVELATANRELQAKIAELDRTQSYLSNLIDSMSSGLIGVDQQGMVTKTNRATRELTGWEDVDVLGRHWEEMFAPASRESLRSDPRGQTTWQDVEVDLLGRDEKQIPVRASSAPVVDEYGETQGLIVTFIDLSNVRLLEERVRRADRLAALGELAAGVAHELRNPLTTLRGFVQILPEEHGDPEFVQDFSTNVLREIDRLTGLTEDLLTLARPPRLNYEQVDAAELIEEILVFLDGKFTGKNLRLEKKFGNNTVAIPMDRDRVKQVLLNLLLNAIDACAEEGTISVRLGVRKEELNEKGGEEPFAVIEIGDTGCGIAREDLDRLFDPFFTTKDHGTGLGLAVSHRIVEEHRGFLRAESQLGQGTTFTLWLPLKADYKVELVR